MKNLFIDTDVIIDYLIDRLPYAQSALEIFEYCLEKNITIYATSITFANAYYILRKEYSHTDIINKLILLNDFVKIAATNQKEIMDALNSNFSDFEDALQNYSALNQGEIETLITRNIKDYLHSTLNILSPIEFLKNFTN